MQELPTFPTQVASGTSVFGQEYTFRSSHAMLATSPSNPSIPTQTPNIFGRFSNLPRWVGVDGHWISLPWLIFNPQQQQGLTNPENSDEESDPEPFYVLVERQRRRRRRRRDRFRRRYCVFLSKLGVYVIKPTHHAGAA